MKGQNMAHIWKECYHDDTTVKSDLSEQEIEYLKTFQKELNTQKINGQALPYYFVIRDYDKVYGENLNNPDGTVFIDNSSDSDHDIMLDTNDLNGYYDINDIVKKLAEYCDSHHIDYDKEYLDNIIDEHDLDKAFTDIYVCEYETVAKDSNMFLTQKAAQDFLKANSYHFSDKAHTYCQTVWRSDEMPLFNILAKIDLDHLPVNKPGMTRNILNL